MAQEISFGVQKELITPRLVIDATAAHWIFVALCDAGILVLPFLCLLAREIFWGFTFAFPGFVPFARGKGFYGFLVLKMLVFSHFFL